MCDGRQAEGEGIERVFEGVGAGAVLRECRVPGSEDAGLLEDAELVRCEADGLCVRWWWSWCEGDP